MKMLDDKRRTKNIRANAANLGDMVVFIYFEVKQLTRQSKTSHIIGGDAISWTQKESAVH